MRPRDPRRTQSRVTSIANMANLANNDYQQPSIVVVTAKKYPKATFNSTSAIEQS